MKRNKTNKAWVRQHVNDFYVRQAKHLGYRSRAAFKLIEINEKDRLLRSGMVVVDLGAAPGGWSQYAAKCVVPQGRVIAVDKLEMESIHGVTSINGDFQEADVVSEIEKLLDNGKADIVICDMAPNLSGIASADQARVMGLAESALEFSSRCLKPKGCFLVKSFQGMGFDDFLKAMRVTFKKVDVRKPKASREGSNEVYLLGKELVIA